MLPSTDIVNIVNDEKLGPPDNNSPNLESSCDNQESAVPESPHWSILSEVVSYHSVPPPDGLDITPLQPDFSPDQTPPHDSEAPPLHTPLIISSLRMVLRLSSQQLILMMKLLMSALLLSALSMSLKIVLFNLNTHLLSTLKATHVVLSLMVRPSLS